jgi:hypothetical protein
MSEEQVEKTLKYLSWVVLALTVLVVVSQFVIFTELEKLSV